MIASLALTAALAFNYPATYFHFDRVAIHGKYDYAQAQILVDPTAPGSAYADTQSGWVGAQSGVSDLVQAGWIRFMGQEELFYQVWGNGGIVANQEIPFSGSEASVAVAYAGNKWTVLIDAGAGMSPAWTGTVPMSPSSAKWELATESYDSNRPSPLSAAAGLGTGSYSPWQMGQ